MKFIRQDGFPTLPSACVTLTFVVGVTIAMLFPDIAVPVLLGAVLTILGIATLVMLKILAAMYLMMELL